MADLKQQLDEHIKALMERVGLGEVNPVVLYVALAVILFILYSGGGDDGNSKARSKRSKTSQPYMCKHIFLYYVELAFSC